MSKQLRMATFKLIDILVILTMVLASPMSITAAALESGPALATDEAEYEVGATARLSGSGFAEGNYLVVANGVEWANVSVDGSGVFVAESPALQEAGDYDVRVYAADWSEDWEETPLASTSLTVVAPPPPTEAPTEAPTVEVTEEPTQEPTAEPTQEPTEEPTATEPPTAEPTEEPTFTPTDTPTDEPTPTPTSTPTDEPTATATSTPTNSPTVEPTATLPPTPSEPPYIQSGKEDYAPGERVTLMGGNWQGDAEVRIIVNDDVGQTWRREVIVTVAADGTISDSFNLPTFFVATYTVVARGLQTDRVARTTFTDKPAVNLDQCANFGTTCNSGTSNQWQNGNLGSSQARYFEGDSVPYRAVLTGLEAGQTYTLTIEYDTTQSGKHAIDYLTTFNRTETTADPCSGVAGVPSCASSSFPIPLDPNVSGAGVTQLSGQNFTVYNGTITGASAYTLGGTYGGNSSTSITLTFTAAANGTTIIAWGGHIATRADWGANNSAVSISGSPYHMRLVTFTCSNVSNCSVGQQDRSLSADAVVFPASITIIKDATPNGSSSFPFTASPSPLTNFSLVDNGTSANTKVFSNITNFTTYTVTENVPSGWSLTNIVCTVTSPNTGTQTVNLGTATVSINLKEGENVTCTFNDELTFVAAPSIDVEKYVSVDAGATWEDADSPTGPFLNSGTNPQFKFVVTNTGNVALSSVSLTDTDIFAFYQSDLTTACTIPSTLAPGGTFTCYASLTWAAGQHTNTATASGTYSSTTYINTDDANYFGNAPALTLVKTATPTTYDSVGDVINYSYLVTNSGNVKLAGPVTISDDKTTATCPNVNTVGNLDGFLDPGESITCSATYSITQADLNAGSVTNTATASAGSTNSNQDSETVTATQSPSLLLAKTASPATYDSVSDVISYSYVVTNNGNVRLAGPVTVADNKATVTCPNVNTVGDGDGFLDPGESVTCIASYTITQSDLNAGSVTNTAMASAGGTNSNQDSETVTAVQSPQLTLVKTATPSTYASVGHVISYSYLVSNTGNIRLSGPVTVTDDKATVTCPNVNTVGNLDAFLDSGESITCTASYAITQSDLNAGSVTNTAQAQAGGTNSNTDTETVNALQTRELTLEKTASPLTYDAVGDVINYSFVVTNSGNVSLAGPVTITDDQSTDEACPNVNTVGNLDGFLDPGESITCTATYTILQGDLNAGSVTNTAQAHADGTDSNTDMATVTADQSPELTLEKSATPTTYAAVDDVISYSYLLTNSGNVTLSGPFTVTDDKTTVTCPSTSSLAPGASITCSATYTITQADLDAGSVTNTAQAHANGTDSNEDDETVTAEQNPALAVEKVFTSNDDEDGSGTVSLNDTLHYTITATNTGNVTLHNVKVDDSLTSGTTTCASVAPGNTCVLNVTYVVTQTDADAGNIHNVGTADSDETPPTEEDEDVPVPQNPALSLEKMGTLDAGANGYADEGEIITYTFVVTNTGNVTLANVTVTDPLPSLSAITCDSNTIPVSEFITCTATYAVTQDDIDAGFVANLAAADSDESDPDSDDETVNLPQNPALELTKTGAWVDGDADGYADAGEAINYTFEVCNIGNVTLTNVTVSDPLVSVVGGPTTLDVSECDSVTFSGTYTITQADIDAGKVDNTATAYSDESDPDSDDETVILPQNSALSLEKTGTFDAGANGYADPGEVITYTFVVTNTGNVTLHHVSVTDPLAGLSTITCEATTIPVGGFVTCTAAYAVTQDDIDFGSVHNLATADSNESEPDTDEETVPLPQNPALSVEKTGTFDAGANGYADPGESITYTFVVTNTGNVTLTNITVTDPLAGLSTITCDAATIPVGGFVNCTATYAVTQDDIDAGFVTNLAAADSDESEPDQDGETVTLPQNHALAIDKSASPEILPEPGGPVDFTVIITNTGNTTLSLTSLDDDVYGDIAASANPAINSTTCAVPQTIAVDGSYQCTFNANVTGEPGTYTDTVTATANNVTASDDATVELTDVPPTIKVEKTANPVAVPETGGSVTFTFKVTNTSFELVTLTSLSDSIYGTLTGDTDCEIGIELAAGAFCEFTLTQWVEGDFSGSDHENVFTAVAEDNDGSQATDNDNATVDFTDVAPAIEVTKTADPTEVPETGGNVSFTFKVQNTSSEEPVTILSLEDSVYGTLAGDGDCQVTTELATGAFCEFTLTQWVEGDFSGADHENIFTAVAEDNDGTDATDEDSATVDFTNVAPAIQVTKTADPIEVPETGADVTFTFTVQNTSTEEPVTITSLSDSDFGTLSGDDDCKVGTILAAGASCVFTLNQLISGDLSGPDHTNTFTAVATDNDGTEATDNGDATVTFTDVPPAIMVTKTADPTQVPETGANVTFTFTVANVSLYEFVTILSLTDSVYGALAGDADCQVGTVLPPGSNCQFSITRWVEGDFSGPDHTNTFTAVAEDNEGTDATDNDDAIVVLTDVLPTVDLTKTAAPLSLPEPGGVFTFTLSITNTSVETVTITGLGDSNVLSPQNTPDCLALVGMTLTPGQTVSCQYDVTHTDAGTYENTADVTVADNEGNPALDSDSETVTVTDVAPTVTLDKSVSPSTLPEPGGLFTYTLSITNTSVETVTISALTDDNTLSQECQDLVGTTLVAGTSTSCTYTVTHIDAGTYPNTASVTVEDNEGNEASAEDSETVEVTNVNPVVSIVKSASPLSLPEPGGVFTFTLAITNDSNVSDPFTITDLSDTQSGATDFSACEALVGTTLDPGESASCIYTVTHTDAGAYGNTATVTGIDDEGNETSDFDEETVIVTDVLPTVQLIKDVTPSTLPEPGGVFTFTLSITNTSVETVTITALTDDNALSVQCLALVGTTLAAEASTSCQYPATHTDAGTYPNTASVTVKDNENNTASDTDDKTVAVTDVAPTVQLIKDGTPATLPEPGGVFTFTLSITNTSVETVTITALTDDNALSAQCTALIGTTLAAGASTSCTYSITHTDAGTYPNIASVTVEDNEGNEASDTDSETVTVTDILPNIDVEKYVSVNGGTWVDADSPTGPFATQGDTVQFKFVVTNNSVETVTIDSLTDSSFDLSGCTIPTTLAAGSSFECTITTTASIGQHTNTATVVASDNDGNSDTDTDDANYYGLKRGQPSIAINSLTISINRARTTVTGQFTITDESEGGNQPDGFLIALTTYGVRWETKTSAKNNPFQPLSPAGGCTYTLVSSDVPQAPGWSPGDPIIFDEKVTIGYSCTFGSTQLPRGGTLRGTAYAELFGRPGHVFTFSSTAAIPK